MEKTTTAVTRAWGATIGLAVTGLVLCGLTVVGFFTIVIGAITLALALLPGLLGLAALYMAVAGAATAPCPGCGAKIDGLSTGANDGKLCEGCKKYLEGENGRLWLTDEARVAETPLFGAVLADTFGWPDGCCVCGEPVARKLPVTLTVSTAKSGLGSLAVGAATGGMLLRTGGGKTFTVEVPHCAQHDDGARLASDTNETVKIAFRSYPYQRAFCALNGAAPR